MAGLAVEYTRQLNRLRTASLRPPRAAWSRTGALPGSRSNAEWRSWTAKPTARPIFTANSGRFHLLVSMPGLADLSAVLLLSDLTLLGRRGCAPVRAICAGALHMPALVAAHRDPHLKTFYDSLLNRRKAKLRALIALVRKMLHIIYGIFRLSASCEGSRPLPNFIPS